MGKIKKILENELVGGTQQTDIYPVTSTKAVYDEQNRRLSEFVFDKNNVVSELGDSENLVISQKHVSQEIIQGGVYDVSYHNNSAVFESLQALLSSSNLNTLIPPLVRHGGMSIKFIQGSEQSSDNKYVQYRLMKTSFSTKEIDWQRVVGAKEIEGLQVGSTTPTNIEYSFLAGKKYVFVNKHSDAYSFVPIYVRETESGNNVLVHNLSANETFEFIPQQNYGILRVVSNADGTKSNYTVYDESIGEDVALLKKDVANNTIEIDNVKKGKIFDLASSIIEFEQGAILAENGEDIDMPSTFNIRIRTSGYIKFKENIIIRIPDTIRCQTIYYYDAETKVFDSMRPMGAYGYVTIPYKNNCVIRMTMTRADNTQVITPADVKVFVSKYDDHQQIIVLNDKVTKLENSVAQVQYASNTSTSAPKSVACEFVKDKTYIVRNISQHGEFFALYMRVTEQGENVETISTTLGMGKEVEFTPTQDGHYIRITAPVGYSGSDVSGDVSVSLKGTIVEDINTINKTIGDIQDQISIQRQVTPSVQFDFSHDIIDNDGEADVFGLTPNVYYYPNYLSQLYAKFDALVAAYPNYVSRVDLAEELNIQYPTYASEYKTYMYIFKPTNEAINTTTTKLRKALLVGGEHSGERTSSIALYYIAKGLCKCPNDDYFKLRNSFEIHIIPMLEGYGCIHGGQDPLPSGASPNVGRTNYNGININRNYPTPNWHVSETPGDANYSGASAGSEFETQLVLGIVDQEHYDMVGDYHSHVETAHVAYSELAATPNTDNESKSRAMYSADADISITFKKAYPQYYGVGGDLLPMGPGPNNYANTNGVQYYCMANRGVKLAYLCECPYLVAWTNGKHAGNWEEYFTDVIFNLNEYLFRAQLLRFADWVLKH